MTKVVSCINLKGGVGKTALAVNFAAYCGIQGKKTLLIDLDPQTNATFSTIGVKKWNDEVKVRGTVADLLGAKRHTNAQGVSKTAEQVIVKDVFKNVDVIPSHIDLFTVDLDLASARFRETKLKNSLKDVLSGYDIVICDCPPNLTIPTQNALAFSTHYVVPVTLDFLSAIGVSLLVKRVEEFGQDLDHGLEQAGIVISRVGRPAVHREETDATLRAQFGESILKSVIKERTSVSMAAQSNTSIFSSSDMAAKDEFLAVCEELLKRIEG
ncbi:TPA: AAA family ATPase [Shewanella algae]|uniref:ParA family protein n=1 Tax=Shewanella algae TaxID=38313 RepID=UPI001AAFB3AC|nr:AAA family ATPase [Shewanella algae]MBO2583476.1 AAA family ATPase [Shewanella algae]HEW9976970.1 AAA family ATPase [Shewanella algae]